jgi:hypothetical protein
MGLGVVIRIYAPHRAMLLQRWLKSALPKLILAALLLFVFNYCKQMLALNLRDLCALVLFESVCIAVGLVFTQSIKDYRITCMLTCTMRNFVMGTTFAIMVYPHTEGLHYVMTFTTLIVISGFTWLAINMRTLKRHGI